MSQTSSRPAHILSAIIAILAIVASAGGFFFDDLYRDNAIVKTSWHGNDLVTLVVAVPILVVALIFSIRGSHRSQLVWLGMLDYTLYNFGFYLFGTAFNRFFLVYVALFALSILALIFGVVSIDANNISHEFRPRTPTKWISGYMLFVAAGLSAVYLAQSLGFIATGQLPQIVVDTAHPTSVVFALDLSLVVPYLILGAIWLWKRRPWGYVVAAIVNVKGTVYLLALSAATVSVATAGFPGASAQIPLWGVLAVGHLLASLFLLMNIEPANR